MSSDKLYLTREKLEDILSLTGIRIVSETANDFIGYCPFHSNHDSPAWNMYKRPPYMWKCHNAKCGQKGNIYSLLTKKGYTRKEARKLLLRGSVEVDDLTEFIRQLMHEDKEECNKWLEIDPEKFAEEDKEHGDIARNYAENRGIDDPAFDYFKMGYSHAKHMLVIPTFGETGELIGVIGRSIEGKSYRYSAGLERGATIWNLNNVINIKPRVSSIVLTEGSLDAVYLWQAGIKNVGAVLGSAISDNQWRLLKAHFYEIICFFDNDDAGIKLTNSLMDTVKGMGVRAVRYPDRMVKYIDKEGQEQERPVKDPGELTKTEIRQAILNSKDQIAHILENN